MQPYGLIFDLDGVITNTSEYHYLAWQRLADEEGISFSRDQNEQLRGVSRRESLNRLLNGQEISETTAQELMHRKNEYYNALVASITPADILPGVDELLGKAREQHYRIGLASASRNALTVIEGLGLREMFDVIGDGNAVCNSKPAVDLFVWVAGGLEVPVSNCIVFEDAEAGVEAGLHAGMFVVGIGHAQRVGKAHHVCNGLHELTVEQVITLVSTQSRSHFA